MNAVMLSELVRLGISSVVAPKNAAAELLTFEMDRAVRYQFALLVVVVSGLASQIIFGFGQETTDEQVTRLWFQTPLGTAAVEAGMLTAIVLATVLVGRAFGGTGNMDDAVLLIAWLQLISLLVQSAFAVFMRVGEILNLSGGAYSGSFGITLTVAVLGYLFWMFVSFVTVLHSFSSTVKVLFGTVLTILFVAVGITSLIATLVAP